MGDCLIPGNGADIQFTTLARADRFVTDRDADPCGRYRGAIESIPPMNGRSTSGISTLPSFC